MKDVISVDNFKKILANFTTRLYMEGGNSAEEITDEAVKATHSLLISKLPDTPENKAVLAEMFGVEK